MIHIDWVFGSISIGGMWVLVVVLWWERHRRNLEVRDEVIKEYGEDVDVGDVDWMRRDGMVMDNHGNGHYIGDEVDHDEWIDGTEPTR